jgi:hypothetical protein
LENKRNKLREAGERERESGRKSRGRCGVGLKIYFKPFQRWTGKHRLANTQELVQPKGSCISRTRRPGLGHTQPRGREHVRSDSIKLDSVDQDGEMGMRSERGKGGGGYKAERQLGIVPRCAREQP